MPMPPMGGAGAAPPGGIPAGGMAAKPPGGTGAATAPTAMLGSQQAGMTQVKLGLEALQKSLSSIPMGSDLHTEILTALSKIGKLLAKDGTGSDSNSIVQQLALLARDAKAQPQQQAALSNIMSGAGAAPPAGGAAVPPMAA